ncbi:hypothetical protein [uncultured Jatrophihabitans sp.]|uniref:hypothetical protein n=1 Tax=uncultured Jatrophihabitans sp. TaxID=1610747 RepID=UPI0035C9F3AF
MVSALGAWVLLALLAPAAGGGLDDVVGLPADEAARVARDLLFHPHPSVHLQGAAWRNADVRSAALDSWLEQVAAVLTAGPMPDQAAADAWADHVTGGLIRRFPLDVAGALVVLASAVAASIEWHLPLDVVGADVVTLPRAPGFAGVQRLLHSGVDDEQFLASTDLGLLAVHAGRSAGDDLDVVSVCGPPDAAPGDVLAEAYRLAVAVAGADPGLARTDLFDLPLGDGHAWTLTERMTTRGGRHQRVESVLPAWSADTDLDLTSASTGFPRAAQTLAGLVGDPALPTEARQQAMARYTRTGFEAAAVTAVGVRASAIIARDGVERTATLQFVRPYAVVAVARADAGPWSGLPVFSAWVTRADEP